MTENTELTIEKLQDIRSTIYGDEHEYLNLYAPRILAQLITTMQREAKLREILTELVSLKRIKELGPYADIINHDYAKRKPLAWAAAFDAIDLPSEYSDNK